MQFMVCIYSLSPCYPGSSEISASKKPHSKGLLSSLFCCLCHKDTDSSSVKNKSNTPLLVEENGSLSKVSWSLTFPRGISFLSPLPALLFEQHVVSMIVSHLMSETHVFMAQSFSCFLKHLSRTVTYGSGEKYSEINQGVTRKAEMA